MREFTLNLDYYRLLNLHKALLEAKFHTNPDNELVSWSPLVADVFVQVRDLLFQSSKSDQWKDWFQLKNRPDYKERAIILALTNERWNSASDEEKKQIAASYLAPFLYDEMELSDVVAEMNRASKHKSSLV